MQVPQFKGLGYDLTLCFNSIKEKKAASAFKKQRQKIDNIINIAEEPEIILKTYEIEEKLGQLNKIKEKMKSCREIYEKKMFENDKVHLKVEQLNGEALNLISEVEDELIRMKTQAPADETYIQAEGRKNIRTNYSMKLHDIAQDIRDLNMQFLLKSDRQHQITENDWYHKAALDKEMADLMVDRIIDEENEIGNIAQRRDGDITNIATSVEKLASQFKQLHNLVIEQGTILDRIDYNLQQGEMYVNKGKNTLNTANKNRQKQSALARRIIMWQIIMITIFSFLLFLKYRSKTAHRTPVATVNSITS